MSTSNLGMFAGVNIGGIKPSTNGEKNSHTVTMRGTVGTDQEGTIRHQEFTFALWDNSLIRMGKVFHDGATILITFTVATTPFGATTVPVLRVSSAQVLSMSTKAVPTANVAAPDDETDIAAAAATAAGMSSSAPPSAPSSPAKAAASPAGKKTA